MNKQLLMGLLLAIAPLSTLPMGWLTNNSLAKNLTFLSRMRFTKSQPANTTRPYYTKSINYLTQRRGELSNAIHHAESKLREMPNSNDSIANKLANTKSIIADIKKIELIEKTFTDSLENFKQGNASYNSINIHYNNACKFGNVKEILANLEKLNEQSKKMDLIKKEFSSEYKKYFNMFKLPEE